MYYKNVLHMFRIRTLKNMFCSSNKTTNASAMISFKVSFSRKLRNRLVLLLHIKSSIISCLVC
jgi:hypothetical protein